MMTSRRTLATFAAVVGILVSGCSSLPARRSTGARASDPLFPLKPGSVWTYEVRDVAGRTVRLRARVSGEVALGVGGAKATLVEESGGIPGFESHRDLVAYTTRGGLIFRLPWPLPNARVKEPAALARAGEPILPQDPQRQPAWQASYRVPPVEGVPLYELRSESRIAASDDDVVVPAGRFANCLRVDTTVSARASSSAQTPPIVHYYREWYAPGTGLVKAESAVDVEGQRVDVLRAELTSFER